MKRKGAIWIPTIEEFTNIIAESNSLSETLKKLGLRPAGANFGALHKRINKHKINISHFEEARKIQFKELINKKRIPLKKILINGSSYSRSSLKRRLIADKLILNKCQICKSKPKWKGKNLVLVLDHINGIANDNRLKNLRLLCPNCNSQTSTFTGRKNKKEPNKCLDCNTSIQRHSKRCLNCAAKNRGTKINWPSIKVLEKMIKENGFSKTGRMLGVSDNAIRKHLNVYIKRFPRPIKRYPR